MGFWARLFGGSGGPASRPTPIAPTPAAAVPRHVPLIQRGVRLPSGAVIIKEYPATSEGTSRAHGLMGVVGESHYQPALQQLRAACPDGSCRVTLQAEPTNQYDPNAVRICDSGGQTLGYLRREVAKEVQAFLIGAGPMAVGAELTGGQPGQATGITLHDWETVRDAKAEWKKAQPHAKRKPPA